MEKIITASGKGIQAGNGDFAENVQCLQLVVLLENLLGENISGNRFEAGRISSGRKKQKKIEKKVSEIRSWVRFLQFSEEEAIILTPSLKILDEKIQPLTMDDLDALLFAHLKKLGSQTRWEMNEKSIVPCGKRGSWDFCL
ncbi:MAG: hypothetical protein LUD18_09105 [Lachnospiraceae bacterium]|nr:hypothetical protein [Lachnospiraceae bacterium]